MTTIRTMSLIVLILTMSITNAQINNFTNYEAFIEKTPLPYPMSDMTVITFPELFYNDGQGPRMYIVGGCINPYKDTGVVGYQKCYPGQGFCACTTLSDKVFYYLPQSDSFNTSPLAKLPEPRIQHNAASVAQYYFVAGGRDSNGNLLQNVLRQIILLLILVYYYI